VEIDQELIPFDVHPARHQHLKAHALHLCQASYGPPSPKMIFMSQLHTAAIGTELYMAFSLKFTHQLSARSMDAHGQLQLINGASE